MTVNFDFKVVERPKQERARSQEPNPFDETIADLSENGKPNQAIAFTIAGVTPPKDEPVLKNGKPVLNDDKTPKTRVVVDGQVAKTTRQLRAAGTKLDPPVTVRTKVTYEGTVATVTFWCVPKVEVKPKDKPADAPQK